MKSTPHRRLDFRVVCIVVTVLCSTPRAAGQPKDRQPALIIEYPQDGSIFPPEITSPTFIWSDAAADATRWRIDISFADGSAEMHMRSAGAPLVIGEIDQRCVSSTNELPKLTAEQAAAHTWIPTTEQWDAIKRHSVKRVAVITISGFNQEDASHPVSRGQVTILTSRDAVGAPIFYRDVPLMPSETQKGIIKPLAPSAIPLIAWRLRDIREPKSRVVLTDMPTCANCHSFSRDGKTMGMDMDGPGNDKGLYAVVPVKPEMAINTSDMISRNPSLDPKVSPNRVGFMSQISPDGKYVLTTVNTSDRLTETNYYVVNFKDYRFLQVFYPTRGILAWYDRAAGRREPLPGADDPRFVQTDGVWSPDGSYIVFARAEAKEAYPRDGRLATYANDPAEVQIQYNLYRVPFNHGQGGKPQPILGASANGMSNTFPKVSPDGQWIVFVKCRNGQLMRPDSQLYIVPSGGGEARRMRCNTRLMNSWHSFSPNGRWMVFSSKNRSPYTQMYLTHVDEEGNDSPAILVDNSTAANRAVNLPEFVNIPADGLLAIRTPAVEMYKQFNHAAELAEGGQYAAAIAEWRSLAATNPDDARIRSNLGSALAHAGRDAEAVNEFEKALELNPQAHGIYNNLGRSLLAAGRPDDAIHILEQGLQYYPESADMLDHLGLALASKGRIGEARAEFDKAMLVHPGDVVARFGLGAASAYTGDWSTAIIEYREAVRLSPENELAHVYLGDALRQNGDLDGAIAEYRAALKLNPNRDDVHATLGAALWGKKDWDGEIKEEREALHLNPGNKAAHALLGVALGHKGDWEGDIAEQRQALRLDPNDDRVHLNLGAALGHKDDWAGTVAQYREALRLNPKDEEAHALLGTALGSKGDWDGEIAEEREALVLNPKNGEAHYALAFALERNGNRREALQEYQKAYELYPDGDGYRQACERLIQQAGGR